MHIFGLGKTRATQYLKDKEHLENLVLHCIIRNEATENVEEDFEYLEPPQNTKAIKVSFYRGETFPKWLSSHASRVRLELDYCKKCKYLPPLHHLPSLPEFRLENLSALEYVSDREWNKGDHLSKSFPFLEKLEIRGCVNLKGWWRREREFW